jgi:hypothetical protein
MTANSMIRSFHAARNRAGLRDEEFRDWLERDFGTRHISELGTKAPAALRAINGKADAVAKLTGRRQLGGPYAPKLQALWLSAWNLGIVRNQADEAMLAFVERQTGIQRTEFLRNWKDARKAVEALKSWIAREGAVNWGAFEDPQDAVIAAQISALNLKPEDVTISGQGMPEAVAAIGKIAVMQTLGERIRRAK